jgi:AmmeMemoRadiSam system protein B
MRSYSGPTAAWAYKPLELEGVRRIFVLGPSHHVALRKPAVSGSSVCETPVGNLTVDTATRDALLATGLFDTTPQSVDEDEHSIEMHLPYIAQLVQDRDISVVPIIVGHLNSRQLEGYAQVFAPYLDNPENLFVVSSDFCHWGSRFRYQPHDKSKGEVHEFISWLDHRGMALIESQDPDAFARYLDETDNTICGRYPIMVNGVVEVPGGKTGEESNRH